MKRVLIFSLAYYPHHVSGAEVAIKEITDRIDPSEIIFDLVTLSFDSTLPSEEQVGRVRVHRVGSGGSYLSKLLFIPRAAQKARELHAQHPFDAVWAMMTYMLFPTLVARALGVRVPYLLTLQDGDPYEKVFERWFIRPLGPLLNRGFRGATVIQAISKYLATWPSKRGYRGPVEVIPNGFSQESLQSYEASDLDALKREVGKTADTTLVVTISRLVHQKGIDTVIRALALLPASTRLAVVGGGPDRTMLEQLASRLGVADRVYFAGQVDRTMTAKYRNIADIFVSPSRSEGQGIAFVSTMAAGVPVVATQVGGLADFIFDAKRDPTKPTTAWAVDPDSPEQIAGAVKEILANPARAQEVALTAKRYVLEHYDWDVIARDMRSRAFAPLFANMAPTATRIGTPALDSMP